jgi:WXG100 family type VII secretion target
MAIAKYDFEGMRQQASKVANGATELSNLIKTIDGVVADMKDAWSDPAQQKFEQEWLEMSKKLKEYVPIIEEYGKAVNNHADKVERAGSGI